MGYIPVDLQLTHIETWSSKTNDGHLGTHCQSRSGYVKSLTLHTFSDPSLEFSQCCLLYSDNGLMKLLLLRIFEKVFLNYETFHFNNRKNPLGWMNISQKNTSRINSPWNTHKKTTTWNFLSSLLEPYAESRFPFSKVLRTENLWYVRTANSLP